MDNQSFNWTSFASKFRAAPLELRLYALFSVTVTILDLTLTFLGPKSIKEAIVPITGWSASMGYMFGLYFTFFLILKPVPAWRSIRFAVVVTLLISMAYGLYNLSKINRPNSANPYLTVSPWQPLWTLVLPAVWIAVLYSPRIKKFCEERLHPLAT
jgi:hypothetical protein